MIYQVLHCLSSTNTVKPHWAATFLVRSENMCCSSLMTITFAIPLSGHLPFKAKFVTAEKSFYCTNFLTEIDNNSRPIRQDTWCMLFTK